MERNEFVPLDVIGHMDNLKKERDEAIAQIKHLQAINSDLLLVARLFWAIKHETDPDFDMYGVCIELGLENEYMEQKPWMEILEEKAVAAIAKAMGDENGTEQI